MAIDASEIDKLAALSRIEVGEEEKKGLLLDMESVLDYVSEIQEVSGDAVLKERNPLPKNRFRDDGQIHESGIHTEKLLMAAPEREGDYFKVKKIL